MDKKIIKSAALQALGAALYIGAVATFMNNAQFFLGKLEGGILGTILFLLIFVISAGTMGVLVFGRPVAWYLDGLKREAILLVSATLGFLVVIAIIILAVVFFSAAAA